MEVTLLTIEVSNKQRLQKLSTKRLPEGPIPKKLQQVNLETFYKSLFDFNSLYLMVISFTDSTFPKK